MPLVWSTPPLSWRMLAAGKPTPSSACSVGVPVEGAAGVATLPVIWPSVVMPLYVLLPVTMSLPLSLAGAWTVRLDPLSPASRR